MRSSCKALFPGLLASLLVMGLANAFGPSALAAPHAEDDFDPRGRPRTRPSSTSSPAPRSPSTHPARPTSPAPSRPLPRDGSSPSSRAADIDRYLAIVLAQPGAPFPLQKLAQLARERDGGLASIIATVDARAQGAGPDRFAAIVAHAGLLALDGRMDESVRRYEAALALKGNDSAVLVAFAKVLEAKGDGARARATYERALSSVRDSNDKETILRSLMGQSLDAGAIDDARRFHRALVALHPESLSTRGELAHQLFQRERFDDAVIEFRELVAAAAGDNRVVAPALRDLGRALARSGKVDEAKKALKRALAAAGSQSSLRADIYETMAEVHRADQTLGALVVELEAGAGGDAARLALLASIFDELGEQAKALAAYRRALAIDPRHVDWRIKVVRILQARGELDAAIAEFNTLVRMMPSEPRFVFELCEALLQRGDRTRALRMLSDLERRSSSDEDTLARVAEFYGRIGEAALSVRTLEQVARLAPNDPSHLGDLGARYFQDGKKDLALQTW